MDKIDQIWNAMQSLYGNVYTMQNGDFASIVDGGMVVFHTVSYSNGVIQVTKKIDGRLSHCCYKF